MPLCALSAAVVLLLAGAEATVYDGFTSQTSTDPCTLGECPLAYALILQLATSHTALWHERHKHLLQQVWNVQGWQRRPQHLL